MYGNIGEAQDRNGFSANGSLHFGKDKGSRLALVPESFWPMSLVLRDLHAGFSIITYRESVVPRLLLWIDNKLPFLMF